MLQMTGQVIPDLWNKPKSCIMQLKNYREKSYKYTEKASEIARSMMLAGIGIIWIIRTDKNGLTLSDRELLFPLTIMAITLIVDFLQYLLGGTIWIAFYKKHEKAGNKDTDSVLNTKKWRTNVLYFIYYLKFTGTILAYFLIIKALFKYY